MGTRNIDVSIVTNTAGNLTFNTDDIIDISIQRSITDGSFGIGYTQSDRLTFRASSGVKLPKKTRTTVYVNIDDAGNKRLGRFYVKECTRDGSVITVTAYDKMYSQSKAHVRFGGKASIGLAELDFPCTMQDMLDYICTLRSFTCDFQCEPFTVGKKPKKPDGTYFTVRELIGFIAACHGANAKFDGEGALAFKYFERSSESITASDASAFTLDDSEPYQVTGLLFTIDNDTMPIYIDDVAGSDYDEDDIGVIKCYNPLATVEIANYAWTKIGKFAYYGGSVTRRGTGNTECGDVIQIGNLKYPADEQRYQIGITDITYSISASGGFTETLSSQIIKESDGGNGSVPSGGGGSGSGVGEFLDPDHTTEIFNCYKDTRWGDSKNSSVMKYDHVEGCGNIIEAEDDIWRYFGYNHFQGYNNKGFMVFYSFVGGSGNTLGTKPDEGVSYGNWNTDSFMYGSNNKADHIQNGTVILGAQNKGTNLSSCYVLGSQVEMSDSQYSAAIGNALKVTNGNKCLILGTGTINARNLILALVGNSYNYFTVSDSGDVYALGSVSASQYITRSADIAEYFEWADGNPEADERMGLLVDQIGDKIAPAQGDEFFGAISARASVVGNAYEDYWHGKYVTDVYGRVQYDEDGHALISPDFDPARIYIPRSQRPEWAVTGLTGRIIVRDDGSCIPGGYVSARQGIATKCYKKTAGRMLRRIDEKHIEILLK